MAMPSGSEGADAAMSVDTGAGSSVPVTEGLKQSLTGTSGRSEYFFKIPLPMAEMTGTGTATPSGTVIASVQLDGGFDQTILDLKKQFMFYGFKDVTLVLKCASPFSTASGTAQLFYNSDPENPFDASDPHAILKSTVRLSQSMQVSAKTDAVIQLPADQLNCPLTGSNKRWCKKAVNTQPRTERFGDIGMIVRGAPSLGDGSCWAVTLEGQAFFEGPTINSNIAYRRMTVPEGHITDCYAILNNNGIDLQLRHSESFLKNGIYGTFNGPQNKQFRLDLGETGGTDVIESHFVSLGHGTFIGGDPSDPTFLFPTRIHSVTQIEAPEVIAFDEAYVLSGDVIYQVDEEDFKGPHGLLSRSQVDNISTTPGTQSPALALAIRRRMGIVTRAVSGFAKYYWSGENLVSSSK